MAAKTSEMWVLREMDSLWFYQFILLSKNSLFLFPGTSKTHSESPGYSSTNSSQISVFTGSQDETSSHESDHDHKKHTTHDDQNRPNGLNLVSSRTKSRKTGQSRDPTTRLQKTTSCKSLGELELEELKGFMDLGFDFKREKASEHLMRLIPGLQRLDSNVDEDEGDGDDDDNDDGEERKGMMGTTMRPYLSEAWLVKRPDYDYPPLMDMRLSRACTDEDMKKRLKCWARAIASAVHQGSR